MTHILNLEDKNISIIYMNNLNNFKNLISKKRWLIFCIFFTLLLQLSITIGTYFYIDKNPKLKKQLQIENNNIFKLGFIFLFLIILIIAMVSFNLPFSIRFLMFTIFSIIQGIFFLFATHHIPNEIIKAALVSTNFIFILFLIVGTILVYFKINLSFLYLFLIFSLIFIIISRIINFFMVYSSNISKILTVFTLFIFSIFILYDTNNILLRYENTGVDCIRGSLDYYLNLINIFSSMLNLNSE